MSARPDAALYGGAVPRRRVDAIRRAFRALGMRARDGTGPAGRRAVIVHLDGVSRHVLSAAIRAGRMPFLSRLLDAGAARLFPSLAGAPASTSAFQAGLLFGAVDDVPGYLWWDKRAGVPVRMDSSARARDVEARHARRDPGLLTGGTSYTTMFRGGARPAVANLGDASSAWQSSFRHWPLPAAAAVHGALAANGLVRLLLESPRYVAQALAWSARLRRHEWEGRLVGMRLLHAVPLRQMATWGAVGDMALGVPLIYACFVEYDEVAHRRGPLHEAALAHLTAIDGCVETIHAAAAAFPENAYDVFVLSDHGMVDAVPFAAIDGRDLPAFLRAAVGGADAAARHLRLRELGDRLAPPVGWIAHEAARREGSAPPPGVQVIDAGDIAHLYFTEVRAPLPLEAIERKHPAILRALRSSAAVPLLGARAADGTAIVLAGTRTFRLDDAADRRALAAHPLFAGRDAATLLAYLSRLVLMPSAGDLVLYGNPGPGRAIAFSWEFGSHGGLAAPELETFVISPPETPFDFSAVRQPEDLHRFFVRYRPPLRRHQDRASDVAVDDPDAARAIAGGEALPDPSAAAARSSDCDASHVEPSPPA